MNRIVILLKTCVTVLIFYVFGYLLRLFFSQIPNWLFISFLIVLLITLFFFVYKKRKEAMEVGDTDEDMSEYLQKSVYLYLIIGCFIGGCLSWSESRATLIIDNGNKFPVEVILSNGEKHLILQDSYIYTSITTGKSTIIINGDSIKIDVTSKDVGYIILIT